LAKLNKSHVNKERSTDNKIAYIVYLFCFLFTIIYGEKEKKKYLNIWQEKKRGGLNNTRKNNKDGNSK
jgi:hypothetical protein